MTKNKPIADQRLTSGSLDGTALRREEVEATCRELLRLRRQFCWLDLRMTFNWTEALMVSVRSYHCLRDAGIRTLSELASKSDADLLKIRSLGVTSVKDIREALERAGYTPEAEAEVRRLVKDIAALNPINTFCYTCREPMEISRKDLQKILAEPWGVHLVCHECYAARRERA